jgi:hypothetical protein
LKDQAAISARLYEIPISCEPDNDPGLSPQLIRAGSQIDQLRGQCLT